jgi:hypothetical protein
MRFDENEEQLLGSMELSGPDLYDNVGKQIGMSADSYGVWAYA